MSNIPTVLVIDDEESLRNVLSDVLESEGWAVSTASSASHAFEIMERQSFDLVFSDVMLGGPDGYEVLRRFAEKQPTARFVLMTGYGSAAGALDATAIGALDYLIKPFSIDDVTAIATSVKHQLARRRPTPDRSDSQTNPYRSEIPVVGMSPEFVNCLKMVGRVAPTNLSVLITGESGTGKEVIANAIHLRSARAAGPFVTVNCAAIPVELIESELFGHVRGSFTGATTDRIGLWEEAAGGTLFLDEITETPHQFQVKLLRALQESEIRRVGSNRTTKVDARVIGATNRDIEQEVLSGRFRQDLMYRLNAVTINLPPLRERVEDIPLLAVHFATRVDPTGVQFSSEALQLMKHYHWPGNVRELENAVLHAVSMANNVIYPEHLPSRIVARTPHGESSDVVDQLTSGERPALSSGGELPSLAEMQVRYVNRVLDETNGNKQAAARILNIDRKTLGRILARGDR